MRKQQSFSYENLAMRIDQTVAYDVDGGSRRWWWHFQLADYLGVSLVETPSYIQFLEFVETSEHTSSSHTTQDVGTCQRKKYTIIKKQIFQASMSQVNAREVIR